MDLIASLVLMQTVVADSALWLAGNRLCYQTDNGDRIYYRTLHELNEKMKKINIRYNTDQVETFFRTVKPEQHNFPPTRNDCMVDWIYNQIMFLEEL